MPATHLKLDVELDNLKDIQLQESPTLQIQVTCNGCQYQYSECYLNPEATYELPNGHAEAHLVLSCRDCRRDMNISFVDVKSYNKANKRKPLEEASFADGFFAKLKDGKGTLCLVDCRNCTITSWKTNAPFVALGTEDSSFPDIDLTDEELFLDVDTNNDPVGVTGVTFTVE